MTTDTITCELATPFTDEADPPTEAAALKSLMRLSIDHSSRFDVTLARYVDHEPIRAIDIIDETGNYTTVSFGWSEKHVVALADRLITALTEMRDGALYDLAHPEEARSAS